MVGGGGSGSRERISIYINDWFMLMYSRDHSEAVILQLKKKTNRNENPQIFDVLSTEIWTLFLTTAYPNWLIFF